MCGMCVVVVWLSPPHFFCCLNYVSTMTWELWWLSRINVYIFCWHVVFEVCMLALLQLKWEIHVDNHPCLKLHSHGKFAFTTFNVSTFKLFTFKNVELKDWNTLHIDVRLYGQSLFSSKVIKCIIFHPLLTSTKAPPSQPTCAPNSS